MKTHFQLHKPFLLLLQATSVPLWNSSWPLSGFAVGYSGEKERICSQVITIIGINTISLAFWLLFLFVFYFSLSCSRELWWVGELNVMNTCFFMHFMKKIILCLISKSLKSFSRNRWMYEFFPPFSLHMLTIWCILFLFFTVTWGLI